MTPWKLHWGIVASLFGLGIAAAFALGSEHAHGMFDDTFFLIVVAIFATAHAALSTAAVNKWGTTKARVAGLHAGILIGVPTLFGVVASIVA